MDLVAHSGQWTESTLAYRTRSLFFSGHVQIQSKFTTDDEMSVLLDAVLKPRIGPTLTYRFRSSIDLSDSARPRLLEQQEWVNNQPQRHYQRTKAPRELREGNEGQGAPQFSNHANGLWDPLQFFLAIPEKVIEQKYFESELFLFGKKQVVALEREGLESDGTSPQIWRLHILTGSQRSKRTARLRINFLQNQIESIETEGPLGQSLVLTLES